MTTAEIKVGESLSIGLWFKDNYELPETCNMTVYVGGVIIGDLFSGIPEIERNSIYYTMRLSSEETSLMRGYRDLIVVLDDPEGFGVKKAVVGGITFSRLADEFVSNSENQGFNMLIEMEIDEDAITGSITLIEALKGDKGDKGDKGNKGDPGDTYYRHTQSVSSKT